MKQINPFQCENPDTENIILCENPDPFWMIFQITLGSGVINDFSNCDNRNEL